MINVKKRLESLKNLKSIESVSTYGKSIIYNPEDWLFDSQIVRHENDEVIIFETDEQELVMEYIGDPIKWPFPVKRLRVTFNGTFIGDGLVQLLISVKKPENEILSLQLNLNSFIELDLLETESISLKLLLVGKGELYLSSVDFDPTEILTKGEVFSALKTFNSIREVTVGYAVDIRVERFLQSHLETFNIDPQNWSEYFDIYQPDILIVDNNKLSQWLDILCSQTSLLEFLRDISLYCAEKGVLNTYLNLGPMKETTIPRELLDILFDKVIDIEEAAFSVESPIKLREQPLSIGELSLIRKRLSKNNRFDAIDGFLEKLGVKILSQGNTLTVFSVISSREDFNKVFSMYKKQSWKFKKLIVLLEIFPEYLDILHQFNYNDEISVYLKDYAQEFYKIEDLTDTDYICFFAANCYYGKNYLEDLLLGAKDRGSLVVGKGAYGKVQGKISYVNEESQYSYTDNLQIDRALMDVYSLRDKCIKGLLSLYEGGILQIEGKELFSLDKFNFIEGLNFPVNHIIQDFCQSKKILDNNKEKANLLFAGHDMKFATKIIESFEGSERYNVRIDNWKGHTSYDYVHSKECLEWADIIVCEWGLGNVVWYSQHKKENQRLIVRIHAQEKFTNYHHDFTIENIERFIVVSPWMFEEFHRILGIPRSKMVVISNYLDSESLDKPKWDDYLFNLGFIGMNPKLKRLDRALEIFELLWERDKRFKLYLKGKKPSDLKWLMNREDEKIYFEQLFEKIENSQWKDNVIFEGYGNDIADFLRNIGFVLSTSDHESFHLASAEGMASGAIPVVLNWPGCTHIYPSEFILKDTKEASEYIYNKVLNSEHGDNSFVKSYVSDRYDYSLVCKKWHEIIRGS